MNIYYYEYYDPDVEDHNEPITAYFAATTQSQADALFEGYSQYMRDLDVTDMAKIANEEIDVVLFDKIANFAFAVDDDLLLMTALNLHPEQAPHMIDDLLFSHHMPNSFAHVLSVLQVDEIVPNWLAMVVGNGKLDYTQILLERGVTDCDGSALARACVLGHRDLFDLVYPASNPLQALQSDELRHRDWIEQRMAEEQNTLLHAEILHNNASPLKIKKL